MAKKKLIIGATLITLLITAIQVEASDSKGRNIGNSLISAANYFDGLPIDNIRASRIAQRAGDKLMGVKQCTNGRNIGIRGCIDLSVEKTNGRRFDYRISDQACSSTDPRKSVKRINAKARCYDKYTVLFRVKRNISMVLKNHGVSLYSNSVLQVPGLTPLQVPSTTIKNKWLTVGSMERSTTISNLSGISATMNWLIEMSDGLGNVLGSETGSEAIVPSRNKVTGRRLTTIPPNKYDRCMSGAQTIESGLAIIASKATALCITSSFGLKNFDISNFSSHEESGPYSGHTLGSVCNMLVGDDQQKGSFVGNAYQNDCMNAEAPGNPVDPDDPPDPPDGKQPLAPICPPEGSNIPQQMENILTQDDSGVFYTCNPMVLETCEIDEEMNTCSCQKVVVGGGDPNCTEL